MDLQPVSLSELQVVEGGTHHRNDDLNLVAPYNQGGCSGGTSPGFGSGGGFEGDRNAKKE